MSSAGGGGAGAGGGVFGGELTPQPPEGDMERRRISRGHKKGASTFSATTSTSSQRPKIITNDKDSICNVLRRGEVGEAEVARSA